jgi:hypothetical protein
MGQVTDNADLALAIVRIVREEATRVLLSSPVIARAGADAISSIAGEIADNSVVRMSSVGLRPGAVDRDDLARLALDLVRDRHSDQHLGLYRTLRAVVDLVVDQIEDSGLLLSQVISSIARRRARGSPATIARTDLVDRLVAETRADDRSMSPSPWQISHDESFSEVFSQPNDQAFREAICLVEDPVNLPHPTVFLIPTDDRGLATRQGAADAAGAIRLRGNADELANQLEILSMELEISGMEIESLSWHLSRAQAGRNAGLAMAESVDADPGTSPSETPADRPDATSVASDAYTSGCGHPRTVRGLDVPLVWGSRRSQVCVDCGAFRTHGHHHGDDPDVRGPDVSGWHPACEYVDATSRRDEE